MKNRYVSAARVRDAYRKLDSLIRDPRIPELVLVNQFERATKLELRRREWLEKHARGGKVK